MTINHAACRNSFEAANSDRSFSSNFGGIEKFAIDAARLSISTSCKAEG